MVGFAEHIVTAVLSPQLFLLRKQKRELAWSHTAIIPVLWRLKQEECEFKPSLGYLAKDEMGQGGGGERATEWWGGVMGQEEEMEEEGKRGELLMSVSLAEVMAFLKLFS